MRIDRLRARIARVGGSDYAFLVVVDLGIALNYLVLPDVNYAGSAGLRGPVSLMPVRAWGVVFLALAIGEYVLRRGPRRTWTAFVGVSSQIVFAGGLLQAFINGETGHGKPTQFVGIVLYTAWGVRHLVVAARDPGP